jgi:hypothetical protein
MRRYEVDLVELVSGKDAPKGFLSDFNEPRGELEPR